MIIRHAEKPGISREPPLGIDEDGRLDPHSLTVNGWVRAGFLSSFFSQPSIKPMTLFAAKKHADGFHVDEHGARAFQTLLPLARKRGVSEKDLQRYSLGDEMTLAADVRRLPGPVLISWEHKAVRRL